MAEEKVPIVEKIISLSDSDASFIVKGGWNTVVGYRPQLARSRSGFVSALVLPQGNAADRDFDADELGYSDRGKEQELQHDFVFDVLRRLDRSEEPCQIHVA
jgi:hypothetical protein